MTPRARRRGAMSRDDGGQVGQTVLLAPAAGPCQVPARSTGGPRQVHRRTTGSAGQQLEPGHCPPAAPSPAPPRRQARHHLKPPAAFRIPASTVQLRRPRPAPVGDLDPDHAVPRPDRDRDRRARSARPAIPDTITEKLGYQQGGVIPARVPGTEHSPHECAGDPCPLRPPGQRHGLPNGHPNHQRTRPSPPASPRGRPPGHRADTQGMHAQLSGARQAGTRR
jgi:hypothetical protein